MAKQGDVAAATKPTGAPVSAAKPTTPAELLEKIKQQVSALSPEQVKAKLIEHKEKQARQREKQKGKEKSPEAKDRERAKMKERNQRPEVKAKMKAYMQRPDVKAKMKAREKERRLETKAILDRAKELGITA